MKHETETVPKLLLYFVDNKTATDATQSLCGVLWKYHCPFSYSLLFSFRDYLFPVNICLHFAKLELFKGFLFVLYPWT